MPHTHTRTTAKTPQGANTHFDLLHHFAATSKKTPVNLAFCLTASPQKKRKAAYRSQVLFRFTNGIVLRLAIVHSCCAPCFAPACSIECLATAEPGLFEKRSRTPPSGNGVLEERNRSPPAGHGVSAGSALGAVGAARASVQGARGRQGTLQELDKPRRHI